MCLGGLGAVNKGRPGGPFQSTFPAYFRNLWVHSVEVGKFVLSKSNLDFAGEAQGEH